jgi:hypothetical protein
MITKKIIPVGNVEKNKEGLFMNITSMVAEYRIFGILLYKKTLINPSYFRADNYEGFIINF